jgi:hypothetical protein
MSSSAMRRERPASVFWMKDERVVAGINVNVWDVAAR